MQGGARRQAGSGDGGRKVLRSIQAHSRQALAELVPHLLQAWLRVVLDVQCNIIYLHKRGEEGGLWARITEITADWYKK